MIIYVILSNTCDFFLICVYKRYILDFEYYVKIQHYITFIMKIINKYIIFFSLLLSRML